MAVLITGGAGYIGSHTCVGLLDAGEEIVVLDNLSNSTSDSIDAVKKITGKDFPFYEADILDEDSLRRIFAKNDISEVIHLAALKSVGASVLEPQKYHLNNVTGTEVLCGVMSRHGCRTIVFSSSATVYGAPEKIPVTESSPLSPTNPYGETKLECEKILRRLYDADNSWRVAILRYFNPIGSHKSGLLGDAPKGVPENLMPYIQQVAAGKLDRLRIFGNDYPTHDGTGVRDYIHITDLVRGHICAIDRIRRISGVDVWNLGTGRGYSVLDMVRTFERVNNVAVPYIFTERRNGDIAECYADASKALRELGWKSEKSVEEMCVDSMNSIINEK